MKMKMNSIKTEQDITRDSWGSNSYFVYLLINSTTYYC
jgi:hypothetical protein